MISLVVYVVAVLLFVLVFIWTQLVGSFSHVTHTLREAILVLGNASLNDRAKERAARNAGLRLLQLAFLIALKGAITIIAAIMPFWIADVLALESWEVSIAFALRWDVLVITMVAGVLIWYLLHRRSSPTT